MQHAGLIVGLTMAAVAFGTMCLSLGAGLLRNSSPYGAATLMGLGASAAGLLAYRPLLDKSPWSDLPHDPVQRLWWATAVMSVLLPLLMAVLRRWRLPGISAAILATAVLAPAGVLVVAFIRFPHPDVSIVQFLPRSVGWMWLAVVGGWVLLEPIARRSPGTAAPLTMGFISAGVGGLILMSDSTAPGLSAAVVGASTAGVLLAAWLAWLLLRRMSLAVVSTGGVLMVWLTLLAGFMGFCCLDSDTVPTTNLLLLATAPLLAWIAEIPAVHRWRPWRRELLRAALLAVPVILALARAYVQFRRDNADVDLSWLTVPPSAV